MKKKCANSKSVIQKYLEYAFLLCIYGSLLGISANALSLDQNIKQFYHTAWTAKDGSPGQIRTLAQTNDGYLWLGSSAGLYRFDGVLFDRFEPQPGSVFPSNNIYSLLTSPDGGLWIGYWYGGVSFLKDGNLTNYGESEGLPTGRVQSFARDDEGVIWAATSGGLARLEEGRWHRVGAEWNYPGKAAQAVFVDKAGTLWVAAEETIVFLPKGARTFQLTGERILQVLQMAQSPDGTIFAAETSRSVRPIRLPRPDPRPAGPEIRVGSVAILFDHEGAMWVTTIGDGLRRVPFPDRLRGQTISRFGDNAEIFTEKDGLSADYSSAVLEDREGNIWVGSANGLDRFRESSLVPVRFPPGYQDFGLAAGDDDEIWTGSSNQGANLIRGDIPIYKEPKFGVSSVYRDDEGTIWMGGTVALFRIRGDAYSKIKLPIEPKILGVSSIFKDRAGTLWIYLDQEGIFQLKNGDWTSYNRQTELPKSSPITGAIDSLDRKWFGYAGNILTLIDGENIRIFSRDDGLEVGDIKVIYERLHHLWIGGTLGLAVFEGNRFRMIKTEDAQALAGISGMLERTDGDLWLNTSRGIVQIPLQEVHRVLEDESYKLNYRTFDYLDGLLGAAQQNRPFPTAIEGSDGRLWFSSTKGLVWINPANLATNPAPPPVLIKSLNTDEKTYEPSLSPQLPRGTTSLQIDYTALSLTIPERVRFRYKLEGANDDWQDVGTRRQAFYTNLAPGTYRFRVTAANNDGVWNEEGATLDFTIQPAFYQTLWFRAVALLIGLLICFGLFLVLYRWRISQTTERLNMRFEERLAERTRIAQELHDTFLQGVLGMTMRLQAISHLLPAKPQNAKASLDEVLDQVDTVIEEGRRGIWEIRTSTLNENDLAQAFTLAGEELNKIYPANLTLTIEGESRPLHPFIRDEVYRIGREALTNAFRHSKAAEIEAGIEYSLKNLRIFIRDNGCGISPDFLRSGRIGHLGLLGMRESAEKIGAELKIWSRAESGTEVELIVPYHVAFKRKSSGGLFNRLSDLFGRKKPAPVRQDERE